MGRANNVTDLLTFKNDFMFKVTFYGTIFYSPIIFFIGFYDYSIIKGILWDVYLFSGTC
jgi:hypothetical protein